MTFGEVTTRFKMVLFGNEHVGKTSLVERYINDRFQQEYISTLGYNVFEKILVYKEAVISLMVYDIGGQERFRELRKKYAEGADIAFIVYDITEEETFNMLAGWKDDLTTFADNVSFIIIGNKADLEVERQVPKDEAANRAYELGALDFFETSAKTGSGVEEAFYKLAAETYDSRNK